MNALLYTKTLILLTAFALIACGSDPQMSADDESQSKNEDTSQSQEEDDTPEEPTNTVPPSACTLPINQAFTLQTHDGSQKEAILQGYTTFSVAKAKAFTTPAGTAIAEEYVYIKGKWKKQQGFSGLIMKGKRTAQRVMLEHHEPQLKFTVFHPSPNQSLPQGLEGGASVKIAKKFSLQNSMTTAQDLALTSLDEAMKETALRALRQRVNYKSASWGMPHLHTVDTFYDLTPYGACYAEYLIPGPIKTTQPYLVISEETLRLSQE